MTSIFNFTVDDPSQLNQGDKVLIINYNYNRIHSITTATVKRVLKTKYELEYPDGVTDTYANHPGFGTLEAYGSNRVPRYHGARICSTDNDFVEPWLELQKLKFAAEKKYSELAHHFTEHRFRDSNLNTVTHCDNARTVHTLSAELLELEEKIADFHDLPE